MTNRVSEPIKHVNGLGEVRWQPAIKDSVELRDGRVGEWWSQGQNYGEPILYYTYWWAKRRGRKKIQAEARSTWERVY